MSDSPTNEQTRTVEIPARTADAISARLSGTEFDSVDAYVSFALERLLRELDRTENEPAEAEVDRSRAADEADEAVEERLESLGYL